MTAYQRVTEYNDWEGETWNYWVKYSGNEPELKRLSQAISDIESVGLPVDFTVTDDWLKEDQVDVLVEYGTPVGSYSDLHQKVDTLKLPEELIVEGEYSRELNLYKGFQAR